MADSEILELFITADASRPLEPDVLAELSSIARMHSLSAEDMYFKWDSYCIRREVDATEVTMAMVRAFKQDLQDALEKRARLAAVGGGGGAGASAAGGFGGGGARGARVERTPRGRAAAAGSDVYGM